MMIDVKLQGKEVLMKIINNYTLSNPGAFQGKINPELVKKIQNPDKDFNLQILKDAFVKEKRELSKEDRKILKEAAKKDIMQDLKVYAERIANEYLAKSKI